MKSVIVLACVLAALVANAQPPPTPGSLESRLSADVGKASSLASRKVQPGEIVRGNVIYSGIVVSLLKTGNPLHLVNPPAPPLYGSRENNALRDWTRGPVSGFTLFGISF